MIFTPHLPQEHLRDVLVEAPDPVPLQRDGPLAVLPADANGGLDHPERLWKDRMILVTNFFKGKHMFYPQILGETVDEQRLGKKYFLSFAQKKCFGTFCVGKCSEHNF